MVINVVEEIVPSDDMGRSVCDIVPTILQILKAKGYQGLGSIVGGTFSTSKFGKLKINNIYEVQNWSKSYCGASLGVIIENRFNLDLDEIERIVVFIIDGLNFSEFIRVGKNFYDVISPEFDMVNAVFPTMTVTSTTSILTGVYPIAHGLVSNSFYDEVSGHVRVMGRRISEDAESKYPLVLPLPLYGLAAKDFRFNMISAGISHQDNPEESFFGRFFGEEFNAVGKFIGVQTNNQACIKAKEDLLRLKSEANNNFVTIIRFSVDRLVHTYGIESSQSLSELAKIFQYIIELTQNISKEWSDGKTLVFTTSDHGHKPATGGFVSFTDEIKGHLDFDYKFAAANLSALHLYRTDFHDYILKRGVASGIHLRKEKGQFYAYDEALGKWIQIQNFSPSNLPTFNVADKRYGVGISAGDLVFIADNFFFGYHPCDNYPTAFTQLRATHGGLSASEVNVPLFFWTC